MPKFLVKTRVKMTRQYIVDASNRNVAKQAWSAPPRNEWDDKEEVLEVSDLPDDYDDGLDPPSAEVVACTLTMRPIAQAAKDRRALVFMWGRWRMAEWDPGHSYNPPKPFWQAYDMNIRDSRGHQPEWFIELPDDPESLNAAHITGTDPDMRT